VGKNDSIQEEEKRVAVAVSFLRIPKGAKSNQKRKGRAREHVEKGDSFAPQKKMDTFGKGLSATVKQKKRNAVKGQGTGSDQSSKAPFYSRGE